MVTMMMTVAGFLSPGAARMTSVTREMMASTMRMPVNGSANDLTRRFGTEARLACRKGGCRVLSQQGFSRFAMPVLATPSKSSYTRGITLQVLRVLSNVSVAQGLLTGMPGLE